MLLSPQLHRKPTIFAEMIQFNISLFASKLYTFPSRTSLTVILVRYYGIVMVLRMVSPLPYHWPQSLPRPLTRHQEESRSAFQKLERCSYLLTQNINAVSTVLPSQKQSFLCPWTGSQSINQERATQLFYQSTDMYNSNPDHIYSTVTPAFFGLAVLTSL